MSQDQVARLEVAYEDGISAAAAASARALEQVGVAAEVTETKVTRASASAQTLKNRLDPVAAATKALAAEMRRAAEAQEVLASDMAKGSTSAAEFARAMATAEERVEAARLKLAAARAQAAELGGAHASAAAGAGKFADAADAAASATARHSAQMKQLAPQINDVIASLGSGTPALQVLVQQGGQITQIFGGVRGTVSALSAAVGGPLVIGAAAGAAALAALGLAADRSQARMATLQNQLRATRTDYATLAAEAEAAAKRVAATSGASLADTRTGAQAIASVPTFSGDKAALESYLRTANDLAAVMGKTLPDAARDLAAAMKDPGAEAAKLASSGFPGMSSALAYSIKLMADGGDKAGAFARYLAVVEAATKGAAENTSPLRQEIDKLKQALSDPKSAVGGFFDLVGQAVVNVATATVREVRAIVGAVEWAAEKLGKLGIGSPMPGLPGFGSASKPSGSDAGPLRSDVPGTGSAWRVAPVQSPTGAMAEASRDIYRIAEARNFAGDVETSALQADFATRVAMQESGGNQFGKGGTVLTSGAGALGRMQLMPGTAAGLGANPMDTESNTEGGLKYIAQLWQRFGGDPILVAMAYNWGPGNVQKFLAAKGALAVPAETQTYVKNVTGFDPAGLAQRYGAVALDDVTVTAKRTPGQVADTRNAAFETARSLNGLTFQREQNTAQQQLLQAGIKEAMQAGDTAEVARLTEALTKAKGAAADLITEQQRLARSATDATAPLQAQEGATRDLATVEQQFREAARSAGTGVDETALAAAKVEKLQQLALAHRDVVAQVDRDTAAQQRIAAAYDGGARSVVEATNRQTALQDAKKYFLEGTDAYERAVETETDALNRRSAALAANATRDLGFGQKATLEQIELETKLVGANADVREREIALLKERQRLVAAGGPDAVNTASGRASLENVAKIADATAELKRQQSAFSELQDVGTQAFDRIGSAITSAFATGGDKAIGFGSIAKSVMSEIIQYALKISVLNPVMNTLFGTNRTTLSDAGSVLSTLTSGSGSARYSPNAGGGTQVSGVSSGLETAMSALNTGKGLYSLYKSFTGTGYSNTGIDFVDNTLNYPLYTSGLDTATNTALAGLGEGVYGPTTLGAVQNAGGVVVTPGNLLGLAGSLYGAYSGFSSGTPAGYISGAGSLVAGGLSAAGMAGATIGGMSAASLAGPVAAGAAVVAGIVSLMTKGPPRSKYSTTAVNMQDGLLALGRSDTQDVDAEADRKNAQEDIDKINEYLKSNSIRILAPNYEDKRNPGRLFAIGSNVEGLNQVNNVNEGFTQIRFTTDYNPLKSLIKDQGFESFETFQTKVNALMDDIKNTRDVVLPALLDPTKQEENAGNLKKTLDGINETYDKAREKAKEYELSIDGLAEAQDEARAVAEAALVKAVDQTQESIRIRGVSARGDTQAAELYSFDLSAEQQRDTWKKQLTGLWGDAYAATDDFKTRMAVLEDTLGAERLQIVQKYADQIAQAEAARRSRIDALGPRMDKLWERLATANGDDEDAALMTFDREARDEWKDLSTELVQIYGEGFRDTADFARRMKLLEEVLAAERLAIVKKYGDSGTAAAKASAEAAKSAQSNLTSVFRNLESYARGLRTSDDSPLSPMEQYAAAQRQFRAVAGAAAAGDYKSLSALQGYAETFLATSRDVNGGGVAYAADFDAVLDAVGSAASAPVDTLTASAMAELAREQTDTLVDALAAVQAEVAALRREVAQGAMRPARAA